MSHTTIFIYCLIGVALIYDAYALSKSYESTISWTLYSGAKQWPVIALLSGILMGHLFFSTSGPDGGPAVPDCTPSPSVK